MEHDSREEFGRYYGEFKEGVTYRHWPRKTITEFENHFFSLLTMNHHPVHIDETYAAEQHHGRVLVVGPLVISTVVGMSVRDISGSAVANLEYHDITHDGPVFIGDTIRAESEVLEKRVSESDPDRGIVTVETRAYNQDDEKVLTLRRSILVPKRTAEQ
ncbi:MaoC family dehydratase [Halosimplex marinum]|uniref:MaoC family dehydratase n=1 Tax=Halosimplex marinum TaxID=3396620 RepID=UPI003F57800C